MMMIDLVAATEAMPVGEGAPSATPSPLPVLAPVSRRMRRVRAREGTHAQAHALAQANRQLKAYLGIASHELRGPLTSSSLSVQLAAHQLDLARHQVAPQDAALAGQLAAVQDRLTQAECSLARLTRMLSDLLDVSRLQAGQLAPHRAPTDLRAIVQAAVDEQRQLTPARHIRLHLPARQAVPVCADADRIQQVVTNFLTNAHKYSPADRPVDIRVQIHAGWARVSVRDQGPGLPVVEQARIWEAFRRADGVPVVGASPYTNAHSLGLGLGLYICKLIIEQHQGQVGVHSAPSRGSAFWFALPVIHPEAGATPWAVSDAAWRPYKQILFEQAFIHPEEAAPEWTPASYRRNMGSRPDSGTTLRHDQPDP
jgi:signal transduction histidine kinase